MPFMDASLRKAQHDNILAYNIYICHDERLVLEVGMQPLE